MLREGSLEAKDDKPKGVAAYKEYIWEVHPAKEYEKACLCCAVDVEKSTVRRW